jgi:hypothetical protein
MRTRIAVAAVLAALAVLAGGCFDVEETVSLQRDLSGKASFSMKIDMEPMVEIMAGMQHSMSGKPGPATPEEIAEARRQLLAKEKSDAADPAKKQAELQQARAEAEKQLPAGVKLLAMSIDDEGLKMGARAEFSFDDVHKLAQLNLPQKGGGAAGGSDGNPYQAPFGGLKVVDEGATLLVTLSGADPKSRLQEIKGKIPEPGMQDQIAAAFKGARFAFRLESPFEVVKTNATRREGKVLIWEVSATDPAAQLPETLSARFKK